MSRESPIFLSREPGRYVLPGELREAMRGHWTSAAVGVVLFLGVSCLCGWCWHRLKHVEQWQQQRETFKVERSSPLPMAQQPVGNTLVLVGLLAAACGLVGLAALRGQEEEEDRGEKREESVALERMLPEGLERVDVALMLAAWAHELRDIQGVVEATRRNLGVEDYGAAMQDVENRLRLLHVAMCELGAKFADVSRAYFGPERAAFSEKREEGAV